MNRRFIVAVAAVLIAFAGIGVLGVVASAQEATPQATPTTVSDYIEQLWNAVAEKLGVKRADLDKAIQDAGKDVTSKAVEEGKLTQSQADRMLKRLEQGPGFGMKGPGGMHGDRMGSCVQQTGALAKALGMTTDELSAELRAGKTIDEIAKAKGVDLQAVQKEAQKERINQAVKDGQITQAQADWLIQGLDQGYWPGGRGLWGGMRGHMGRGFGWFEDGDETTPGSPSSPATPNQRYNRGGASAQGNA